MRNTQTPPLFWSSDSWHESQTIPRGSGREISDIHSAAFLQLRSFYVRRLILLQSQGNGNRFSPRVKTTHLVLLVQTLDQLGPLEQSLALLLPLLQLRRRNNTMKTWPHRVLFFLERKLKQIFLRGFAWSGHTTTSWCGGFGPTSWCGEMGLIHHQLVGPEPPHQLVRPDPPH